MKKKEEVTVLIDGSETKLPEIDQSLRCPNHPKIETEIGFGLAGGGYGTYTYCAICGNILSKSIEE